jgi:hypothetical protein
MRRLCCLAVMVALLATCGGVAIAASGQSPHGRLTSTEYTSLGRMIASVKAAAHARPINWSAMRAACVASQTSTALLVSIRSSCEADTLFLRLLFTFQPANARCGQAMRNKLLCQVSLYNALARDDRASYTADVAARTVAAKRGFSGTCLAVISSSARELQLEKELSEATNRLAEDIRASLKAHDGHPIPGFSRTKAENDGEAFQQIYDALQTTPSPSNIRDCPHASPYELVARSSRWPT